MSGERHSNGRLAPLALGALGVVFGDIGTSPLYTMSACFTGPGIAVTPEQAGAFVTAWPRMQVFPDVAEALNTLVSFGWRLAILTNCDDDLFAATSASLPVPFDVVVTAEQVRSYKPDLGHFRKFAEMTGATPANWIHVANSWVHDILPAGRMGLRSVWVDRDHTGHPAKFAERRVTTMRRLAETVTDVSVLPAWPAG